MAQTRRIVLLGKPGHGKSSLANMIFGEEVFESCCAFRSVTAKCQAETREVCGRRLTLIDTPGFLDTDRPEEEMKAEIVECITGCAPGPHAFLIVLKVERFTRHEKEILDQIQACFSKDVLKYATVVFTHGDALGEEMKIEEMVRENESLKAFVKDCGGRCHVFDTKYWNGTATHEYRSNRFQLEELLKTIERMVEENHGGYYDNDMLQQVEKMIKKEEENMRQTSEGKSDEEIRELAKAKIAIFLRKCAGVTTGVLLGAFLGIPVMIGSVVSFLSAAGGAVDTAVGAVAGLAGSTGRIALAAVASVVATGGAIVGGCLGYEEADHARNMKGAVGNTITVMLDNARKCIRRKKSPRTSDDKESVFHGKLKT